MWYWGSKWEFLARWNYRETCAWCKKVKLYGFVVGKGKAAKNAPVKNQEISIVQKLSAMLLFVQ